MEKLTLPGFLMRLAAALLLVLATFNPSGYSYVHWIAHGFPNITAVQAVVGVVLIIVWVIFVAATYRSIGRLGVILIAALFGALTWLAFSLGWLSLERKHAVGWIALVVLAITLAVGVSWSFINRRLTGQVDTDETSPH